MSRKHGISSVKGGGYIPPKKSLEASIFQSAFTAHQAGRLADAADGYRQVLSRNKGHADALHLLGTIYYQMGNIGDAATLIFHALALREDAHFLGNLGLVLAASQRLPEAEAAYRRAIKLKPDYVDAYNNLGNLLKENNRFPEAEIAYRRALELKPDFALASLNLGLVLTELGMIHEAEAAYRQALVANPDFTPAHNALGLLLHEMKCLPEAEVIYRRAVELAPASSLAHNNLGTLLLETKRFAEAEEAYCHAIQLSPNFEEAHSNLGLLFKETKRLPEAEAAYRRVLELKPGYAAARWNLSCLLLSQGRYSEAWPHHEARYDPSRKEAGVGPLNLPYPQWQGESLAGKSLAIWPEQGFGDYIQFIRYVPLLKDQGATRITVVCRAPLKALLETVEGVDAVVTDFSTVPLHDYWSFPLSFPLHFCTTLDTIPNRLPYLKVSTARVNQWRDRIPTEGIKIGLVWKGSIAHKNDINRSLPSLNTLAPILSAPGVTAISLQMGQDRNEPMRSLPNPPVIFIGDEINDFADTAAIVSLLDLVICVDTAVAHVAGALGKPCWVMLPDFGTDWRWLLDRTDSPWYPKVLRLFRQSQHGNWNDVVAEMATNLRDTIC